MERTHTDNQANRDKQPPWYWWSSSPRHILASLINHTIERPIMEPEVSGRQTGIYNREHGWDIHSRRARASRTHEKDILTYSTLERLRTTSCSAHLFIFNFVSTVLFSMFSIVLWYFSFDFDQFCISQISLTSTSTRLASLVLSYQWSSLNSSSWYFRFRLLSLQHLSSQFSLCESPYFSCWV